jgi:DNA-binding response OmpR family regulator
VPEQANERRRTPQVLIVDDDPVARDLHARVVELEGLTPIEVADGDAALRELASSPVALVLLDLGLPGLGGLELLRMIRSASDVPVIVVSGRDETNQRVLALRIGADDYVTKPLSAPELSARVAALLRRTDRRRPRELVRVGSLTIDVATREVRAGGTDVDLRPREFDLLAFLALSPKQVFSREQLLRSVWGSTRDWQDEATVTEHVRRLRLKLEDLDDAPRIATVRGVGYRLEPSPRSARG